MEKLIRLRRLALVFLLALLASSSMTIRVTAPPELAGRTLLNLKVYLLGYSASAASPSSRV